MVEPKLSLKNFFLRFASVVDKGDNPKADILMFKAKKEEPENKDQKVEGGNVMTKTFEEIVKALPEDEQVIVNAEIEKAKEVAKPIEPEIKTVEKETEDIVKSADPKIQEMIKTIKESNEKLEKESEAKDVEIKKFQDDLKKEAIEKTVSTFDRIAVPKEEMVELFTKLDEEAEKIVAKVMKSVNEQLTAANIVKVIGSDSEGEQLNAEATVEKEAKELMKSDTKLTKAQAIVKVYKSKPELYKQYQEEQKGV